MTIPTTSYEESFSIPRLMPGVPSSLASHPRNTKADPAPAFGSGVMDGDRDFFTNIDDFFDPLADDDEPHPAGVALDVAGTRSCQEASPLPQLQGLRRLPLQCRWRTRLKIKAPVSDLGWLCIAAERARGEARIQHSRRAGAQHGRVQCTVL